MSDDTYQGDDDDFRAAAQRDVKRVASAEDVEMLSSDLDRWVEELRVLLKDVEIQFTARRLTNAQKQLETYCVGDQRAWLEWCTEDAEWKLKANRFRVSIETRLRYVKSLRLNAVVV